MKKILFITIILFLAITVNAQMNNPLKEGMPNTVKLPSGEVTYDLSGEWDAIYDNKSLGGITKDIVKITQEGNKFVGIKLIGDQWIGKNKETIKGELENDGFKSIQTNSAIGWIPSTAIIGEKCNKIEIELPVQEVIIEIFLTRK